MAEIIVDNFSRDHPVNLKQDGISVGAEEVDSSPEPEIKPVAISADGPEDGEVEDGDVEIMSGRHGRRKHKDPPPKHIHISPIEQPVIDITHPIYPSNDVFENVRTHLKCQELFTKNINALITQYLLNKQDLERARKDLSDSQSDLRSTRREKERLRSELEETKDKLKATEEDFETTKFKLESAVQELTKTVERLGKAKEELQKARRDLIDVKKRVTNLEIDLNLAKERIQNLEDELRRANHGENVANDRNTELTALLFKAQSEKADIERRKDQLGAELRELQRQVNEREQD